MCGAHVVQRLARMIFVDPFAVQRRDFADPIARIFNETKSDVLLFPPTLSLEHLRNAQQALYPHAILPSSPPIVLVGKPGSAPLLMSMASLV